MKWVKASERLPGNEEGLRIYAKYRGAKITLLFQWGMWLFGTSHTSITESDWKDIEWLDESQPDAVEQEEKDKEIEQLKIKNHADNWFVEDAKKQIKELNARIEELEKLITLKQD